MRYVGDSRTRIIASLLFLLGILPYIPTSPHNTCKAQGLQEIENAHTLTDSIQVQEVRMSTLKKGFNFLDISIKNESSRSVIIGLQIISYQGLWLRNLQRQYVYTIGPKEEKNINPAFVFQGFTSRDSLGVVVGTPEINKWGFIEIKKPFYSKTLDVEMAPGQQTILSHFSKVSTRHFNVYAYNGYLSETELDKIASRREAGLRAITQFLSIDYPEQIQIILFPDQNTKKRETDHTGTGWAFEQNIVEVYNDSTNIDPYHEVIHIVTNRMGNPPAVFWEGLAVYLSEKLGAPALNFLGYNHASIDSTMKDLIERNEIIPLSSLISYTSIGSDETKPRISYPESGSLVKYLVEIYGIQKFSDAYKLLENSSDPIVVENNTRLIHDIYGKSLAEIEKDWIKRLKK